MASGVSNPPEPPIKRGPIIGAIVGVTAMVVGYLAGVIGALIFGFLIAGVALYDIRDDLRRRAAWRRGSRAGGTRVDPGDEATKESGPGPLAGVIAGSVVVALSFLAASAGGLMLGLAISGIAASELFRRRRYTAGVDEPIGGRINPQPHLGNRLDGMRRRMVIAGVVALVALVLAVICTGDGVGIGPGRDLDERLYNDHTAALTLLAWYEIAVLMAAIVHTGMAWSFRISILKGWMVTASLLLYGLAVGLVFTAAAKSFEDIPGRDYDFGRRNSPYAGFTVALVCMLAGPLVVALIGWSFPPRGEETAGGGAAAVSTNRLPFPVWAMGTVGSALVGLLLLGVFLIQTARLDDICFEAYLGPNNKIVAPPVECLDSMRE